MIWQKHFGFETWSHLYLLLVFLPSHDSLCSIPKQTVNAQNRRNKQQQIKQKISKKQKITGKKKHSAQRQEVTKQIYFTWALEMRLQCSLYSPSCLTSFHKVCGKFTSYHTCYHTLTPSNAKLLSFQRKWITILKTLKKKICRDNLSPNILFYMGIELGMWKWGYTRWSIEVLP